VKEEVSRIVMDLSHGGIIDSTFLGSRELGEEKLTSLAIPTETADEEIRNSIRRNSRPGRISLGWSEAATGRTRQKKRGKMSLVGGVKKGCKREITGSGRKKKRSSNITKALGRRGKYDKKGIKSWLGR